MSFASLNLACRHPETMTNWEFVRLAWINSPENASVEDRIALVKEKLSLQARQVVASKARAILSDDPTVPGMLFDRLSIFIPRKFVEHLTEMTD